MAGIILRVSVVPVVVTCPQKTYRRILRKIVLRTLISQQKLNVPWTFLSTCQLHSNDMPKDVLDPQNLMNSIRKTCFSVTIESY